MRRLIALALLSIPLSAQKPMVAGWGYRVPGSQIVAAPGQVMTVSIFGIAGRFPQPVFPTPGTNGFPTTLQGISVDFIQSPTQTALPIRGLQQTSCTLVDNCDPATSITLQIPYEMTVNSAVPAALRFRENGINAAEVTIRRQTDSIHILSTCDQIGAVFNIATGLPSGLCAPAVSHADGKLVTLENPGIPGEVVTLWAYGAGALSAPVPANCCADSSQVPTAALPLYIAFSYADAARAWRRASQSVPDWAGSAGAGVYQVNVLLSAVPQEALAACATGVGTFRISLAGPASSDVAEICLKL